MNTVVHRERETYRLDSKGDHHFQRARRFLDMYLIRYRGQWFTIAPKPFEPERMTTDVAWIQVKEGVSPEEAYRRWVARQRKLSRLLQQG